jgi:hypothetical protein
MQNLKRVLERHLGLELGDWKLLEATGVSADGRTIVGWGTNPNGDTEGWIAVIPRFADFPPGTPENPIRGPTTFDFEDGTSQGWSLNVKASLVETQGLFGEGSDFAIFGFDGASIGITADLTNIGSMTWEEFDAELPAGPLPSLGMMVFLTARPGATPPFDVLGNGDPFSFSNPLTRYQDLSKLKGIQTIYIRWPVLVTLATADQADEPVFHNSGYIGQIVFHPADHEGDGILDEEDNCVFIQNPGQRDADGDGIGNACECGDFNGDGRVNTTDARLIQRCAAGRITCLGLCDANNSGTCDTTDSRRIQRYAVGQITKDALRCAERP